MAVVPVMAMTVSPTAVMVAVAGTMALMPGGDGQESAEMGGFGVGIKIRQVGRVIGLLRLTAGITERAHGATRAWVDVGPIEPGGVARGIAALGRPVIDRMAPSWLSLSHLAPSRLAPSQLSLSRLTSSRVHFRLAGLGMLGLRVRGGLLGGGPTSDLARFLCDGLLGGAPALVLAALATLLAGHR